MFARILLVAALVPLLMRLPLTMVQSLVEPRRFQSGAEAGMGWRILTLVDIALQVGHPVLRHGCLTRGIARYYFLRRAGVDVELAFGVGLPGGTIAGHCWLIKDGNAFLEQQDPRGVFTEVYRIPTRLLSAGPA